MIAGNLGVLMKVIIAVVEGPHTGRAFTFSGHDMFVVGRSRRAHFRLPARDEFFSRHHFLIEVNPPVCRLFDLCSTNGTNVNGRRVTTADLADGDRIEAGQTVLRVSIADDRSEVVTRQAAAPAELQAPAGADAKPEGIPEQAAAAVDGDTEQGHLILSPESCCVCAAMRGEPCPAARVGERGWPVCAACRVAVATQEQPVPGLQIVGELGRGGMGIVSRAIRLRDGAVVALKRILPSADATGSQLERFLREADILRRLDHPNIARFYESGQTGRLLYFVMEHVSGTDAAALVKRDGPLPVPRAVRLVGHILDGLGYAHRRGFVHRDVKPANVLVQTAGGPETAKLADFGLARVYQESRLSGLTLVGDVGGTLAFMSPEQLLSFRDALPPADQYSAAASLYHLLTGHFIYDFPKETLARVRLLLESEPIPIRRRRPELPEALAGTIHKALAREPVDRFADVEAFARALQPFGI